MTENISAVLIVKNEKKVIERCIRSLSGVGEIVVLDTGSTDGTPELSRKLGAVVVVKRFEGPFHFSDARNIAHNHAQNDIILTIDADEVLRAGMTRKIKHEIDQDLSPAAWRVSFTDRGIVTHKKKLYRRSQWVWKYRVHEQLIGPVEKTKAMHEVFFEHLPSPDKSKRHSQNIELLKMTVQESPEYARAFRHLGQEYMLEKEWNEAIPYLAQYLEKSEEAELEKSQVAMHLGECYAQTGRMEDSVAWFEKSAALMPVRREPHYHAGWWLIKTAKAPEDLERACHHLRNCILIEAKLKPGTYYDNISVWGKEPERMLEFCQSQIGLAGK